MSATVTGVLKDGHSGEWTMEKREYTKVYLVTTTNATDGPATVLFARGLPLIGGTPYFGTSDFDAFAICQSLHPQQKQRTQWEVTAKFATMPNEEKKQDEEGKPTNDPFKWRDGIDLSLSQYSRPVEKAIYRDGLKGGAAGRRKAGAEEPPRNSADIVFAPPAERDDSRLVLRITKYKKKFPTDHWTDYKDAINSDVWTYGKQKLGFNKTFEKYTTKLANIGGALKFENDVQYWEVVYEIHVTGKEGWRFQYLDQGVHVGARAGDDDGHGGTVSASEEAATVAKGQPPVRRLTDPDGQPLTEPVLLDGDGAVLAADKEPVYLEYSVYEEKPFAKLGL